MSKRIRGSYDNALYKSTYTLLYFTSRERCVEGGWETWYIDRLTDRVITWTNREMSSADDTARSCGRNTDLALLRLNLLPGCHIRHRQVWPLTYLHFDILPLLVYFCPRESEGICFHWRWFVCLSVTTITRKIVDGFAPNFMQRFLGGKGRPGSCFVMIGRGMWK